MTGGVCVPDDHAGWLMLTAAAGGPPMTDDGGGRSVDVFQSAAGDVGQLFGDRGSYSGYLEAAFESPTLARDAMLYRTYSSEPVTIEVRL